VQQVKEKFLEQRQRLEAEDSLRPP
jgi:hypothetical protein